MIKSIEDLLVYKMAMELGEKIWELVTKWKIFDRDTIGKQIVRSADSIAVNISEGYGRFHYLENKQFCYYARGSIYETKTWLKKSHNWKLISDDSYYDILTLADSTLKYLNNFIKSIGSSKNIPDNEFSQSSASHN